MHELGDREVPLGGLEVLAQSDDIHVPCAQVLHGRHNLLGRFSETQQKRALGVDAGVQGLDVGQHLESLLITGAPVPGVAGQAPDGLDVLADDLRGGADDLSKRADVAAEIRDQHLDDQLRATASGFTDRIGEDASPAVVEVVAVHGGDDHVAEVHSRQGFSHA